MVTTEKQELSRRFAEGYRRLLLLTDGNPPPEWLDLQRRLMEYRKYVGRCCLECRAYFCIHFSLTQFFNHKPPASCATSD
jgi:hypothetical protein